MGRHRLAWLGAVTMLVTIVVETPGGSAPSQAGGDDRPNVLLIMSDDQSPTMFDRTTMPTVFTKLVDRGVIFDRAYVNTSLCCPSRAQILTGLHEVHTGVDENGVMLERPTFVQALQDQGYRTGLFGKYLNSWPCDPRPEFTQWVCLDNHHGGALINPLLNVNGVWAQHTGFQLDLLSEFALDFIDETPTDQPFFALLTPKTPHLPATGDPRCDGFPVAPLRPPNFDEDTQNANKPRYMESQPYTPAKIAEVDDEFARMTRASHCLDGMLSDLLQGLGDRSDETLVVFFSDNGHLNGQHRRVGKQVPYEESVRIPFVVRYPPLIPESQPFVSDALIQTVDIMATIADITGIHWGADGRSLVPLLTQQSTSIRDAVLIQRCQAVTYPCPGGNHELSNVPSYFGVVTATAKYVEYDTGEKELYELTTDPYELTNHAGDPDWAELEGEMASRLAALIAAPPVDTTIVAGPAGPVPEGPQSFTYFTQSRFATYECQLTVDGSPSGWFECDGQSYTTGPLGVGNYTFAVRGTDEWTDTDQSPDTRDFSVTEGGPPALLAMSMHDDDADGRVDGVVLNFSETLAPYEAGTDPWTLASVPSGGTLADVQTSGSTAVLVIAEGSGPPNTATGAFTVALDAVPGGIRDESGNLSSFPPMAPADLAGPVPIAVAETNGATNGKIEPDDQLVVTFSEPLAPGSIDTFVDLAERDPAAGASIDTLDIAGVTDGALPTGSDGYVKRDLKTATFPNSRVTLGNGNRRITVRVGSACAGNGCAHLAKGGPGPFSFVPTAALQDQSGNPATGSFTIASIRLF